MAFKKIIFGAFTCNENYHYEGYNLFYTSFLKVYKRMDTCSLYTDFYSNKPPAFQWNITFHDVNDKNNSDYDVIAIQIFLEFLG